jgi:type IV pilus assembly protein PilW
MRRPSQRGFTLAELLVGLVVTSIVMTAVVAIFIGVQRSYQAETEVKIITENGRGTLLFLERVLPLAGYGIDPRLAFDVSADTSALENRDVKSLTFTPTQPALVGPNDTIVTDDLAFRYRDPAFLKVGRLNGGGTVLTLDEPLGVALPKDKLLLVGCRGGLEARAVRVNADTAAAALTVNVTPDVTAFAANTNGCLEFTGIASPWIFLIQEHRIRIVNLGGRPWLVSFRDLRHTTTDLSLGNFDPISPDVEQFQIAFGMNRARPTLACCQTAPDSGGNWLVGDTVGENFFAQPGSPLATGPDYKTGYDQPARYLAHPGNIRSVHVAMVVRSPRPSPNGRLTAKPATLFNHTATNVTNDGFLRSVFHTSVATPNLLSRTGFSPSIRSAAETRDLNKWGG